MATLPTIGQMRQVIKFELVVKGSDDTGGQLEEYQEWFTTRGYLKKKRGFRDFESGYDETVNKYDLWCYWRNDLEADLTKDVHVVFEARVFSIDHFDLVDEKRKLYHLELTEVR